MRIAFFTDAFLPQINGISTSIANLAQELGTQGHQIIIFVPKLPKKLQKQRNVFSAPNVRVVALPSIPVLIYPEVQLEVFGLPKIIQTLSEFKPDIIHVHTPGTVGLDGIFCSFLFRIPLVGTLHTFITDDEYLKIFVTNKFLMKTVSLFLKNHYISFFHSCDLMFCPSRLLIHQLQKETTLPTPITYLPNTIPKEYLYASLKKKQRAELEKKYALGEHTILHFGRLSGEKSIDHVIHAFAHVCQKDTTSVLLIAGDGPEKKSLEALTHTLGIQHRVRFTGFIDHETLLSSGLLLACTMFVTASPSENQPMAILEAMAFGLPIIAVNEAGMVELIKKDHGFLVRYGDVTALAARMVYLLKHPTIAKNMGKNAKKYVTQFTAKRVVPTLITAYTTLIKKKSKTAIKPL